MGLPSYPSFFLFSLFFLLSASLDISRVVLEINSIVVLVAVITVVMIHFHDALLYVRPVRIRILNPGGLCQFQRPCPTMMAQGEKKQLEPSQRVTR